jgi:hypothetical protein
LDRAHSLPRRLALLAGCLAVGTAVGLAGHAWTGDAAWALAVPAALAAGWLLVADPTRCAAAAPAPQDHEPAP